ncbi:MAG TPA: restriction endonuclease [Armatimonadaceae bacterium]|nr:restriction endonuclease [Armatimonadaceae bacterium]
MAVPEFYKFMRPTLALHADGREYHWKQVADVVIAEMGLTDDDLAEMIPSGRKTRVHDRVQWALTYLRQAGLLEQARRGTNRITTLGRDYLKSAPPVIMPNDLMQFSSFVNFQTRQKTPSGNGSMGMALATDDLSVAEEQTPEEAIETAYRQLNEALAAEVQEQLKGLSPARFEWLIVQLMLRLGYGSAAEDAGKVLGRTGDQGVDGVISQDKLGLDKIYLQAKRYTEQSVGRQEVQAFAGALAGQQAVKGVFITTSTFTREARDYARAAANFKISLIDGVELARLMIDHDLGVSSVQRYDVKRVDSDFFAES